MAHDSVSVANEILRYASSKSISLTLMQLLKLEYIAHGWSLAILNRPLVQEPAQAWQHGPVYPSVYRQFRGAGWQPISTLAKDPFMGSEFVANFDDDERKLLEKVVDSYGRMHAFELSDRTHAPGTPWHQTYQDGLGRSQDIPNSVIKEHFDQLNTVAA